MKSLSFKIITDLEQARKLWDLFSPHQTIDDEWDFRYTFYKYLKFPLHFIVGYDNAQPVGLLPLQLNTNKGMSNRRFGVKEPFLEFFGGIDTDDNKVFLLPGYENLLPKFLNQVMSIAVLAPLADKYKHGRKEAVYYTDKFAVDLKDLKNIEMFIDANFEGKSRRRMKHRISHFNKNYKMEIKNGTESDLELLFALNKDRFGEKSAFNMEHRKQIFRDLANLYKADLFTIFIDGEPKAVSFSVIHKGVYLGLNSGYDFAVRDLGKLVFISKIQKAIELDCRIFDAGKNDNGWKEHFHLNKIPQYKLEINVPKTQISPATRRALRPRTAQFLKIPLH